MCRLLAYVAADPISLIDALGPVDFEDYTALTAIHSDGWGMAWHDDQGTLQHVTSTTCAQHDPQYRELAGQALARTGIVHLRWATPGIPRCIENTHPFVDGDLAMAHNGNITPIDDLDELLTPESRAALEGSTDSERYFRYVVQTIGECDDEITGVTRAVTTLAEQFPAASLNALLLTPARLFAIHVNSHASPPPALKGLGIAAERLRHTDDEYFGMDVRHRGDQTQIVSSGIDPEGWTDLPADSIGILDLASRELTWTKATLAEQRG
ncbi:MAG: class II glutamine amidotransferase [Marmoricola sp.]